MKRWTKIALAVGVMAAAAGSIAWGGHAARGAFMRHMIGARIEAALDYVDATPQQRAVVEQARKEILDTVKARHAAARAVPEQIAELLAADQLDVGKLDALIDQKADQIKALGHELAPQIVKVHDTLTHDQRQKLYAKWKELHAKRLQRMHDRQQQGGFGGPEE